MSSKSFETLWTWILSAESPRFEGPEVPNCAEDARPGDLAF